MREIEFRGKTRISGEWVYGYYVEREGVEYGMIYDLSGLGTKIDKNTLGQYTGLKDRKGKKIYEGDVLKWYPRRTKNYMNVTIRWDEHSAGFSFGNWYENDFPDTEKESEVVGNIYWK
jgi:uncharacterized phage protein (TIGR01671 family)